ncbi:MAG: hypothetical protein M1818_008409 [Claussenomyces sp. TS43310]|nr:MAG: hypothetical protein M1818_008409 [Claussenomyces sp. TS43310]
MISGVANRPKEKRPFSSKYSLLKDEELPTCKNILGESRQQFVGNELFNYQDGGSSEAPFVIEDDDDDDEANTHLDTDMNTNLSESENRQPSTPRSQTLSDSNSGTPKQDQASANNTLEEALDPALVDQSYTATHLGRVRQGRDEELERGERGQAGEKVMLRADEVEARDRTLHLDRSRTSSKR